ncbi:hypothetical protein [Halogeometricum pallidum]|uniref:hypothetical protein n=1 Tax=Halogeometricum pallidum TaxID=411361 RepID=UPI0012694558|nr:hypothetical protein [Halogeometricum pallidum]
MLANQIAATNHLSFQAISGNSVLGKFAKNFARNFVSPLIVTIFSEILGIDRNTVNSLPLFSAQLVIAQGILAYKITRKKIVFLIASLFAVSFQYIQLPILDMAHRVTLGWVFFFFLAYTIVSIRDNKQARYTVAFIIFLLAFIPSYQTLSIACIPFFSTLFILIWISEKETTTSHLIIILLVGVVSYYIIIAGWASRLIPIVIASIHGVSNLTISGPTIAEPLERYLYQQPEATIRSSLFLVSSLTAILILGSTSLYRGYLVYRSKNLRNLSWFDIIIICVIVQGVANTFLSMLFSASGGIDPRLLALLFVPIFGSRLYSIVKRNYSPSVRHVFILVIIIPALFLTVTQPLTPHTNLISVSQEEVTQIEWANKQIPDEEIIVSDFNIASAYKAIGGNGEIYLPPAGTPPYSKQRTAQQLIDIYYENPSVASTHGDVYLVNEQLEEQGIFHLGSITTKPNADLGRQLDKSPRWNRIYSSKNSKIFRGR